MYEYGDFVDRKTRGTITPAMPTERVIVGWML